MLSRIQYLSITLLLFSLLTFITGCQQAESQPAPSLEQKIGQLLMVGFKGYELSDTLHIVRDIEEHNLGGVILFDYHVPGNSPERNIDSAEQVTALNQSLQNLADTPLLISVDQEGGRVARLKSERGFPRTVSAEYLGELNNPDSTRAYATEQADMLNSLGFNVNFAPIVDLNTNPDNPVIGRLERSYSSDPDIVTQHVSVVIEEHGTQNVLPVVKHFPGHGSAWNDSHVGMADVTDTWQDAELDPYRNLQQSGHTFGVMTAHVLNKNLDDERPATLSRKIQTELLQNDIGFDGILFSDDMQMEAIRSFYGLRESLKDALNAGVDVLIFANNSVYQREIVPEAVQIISELIESGEVDEERINDAYNTVMETKQSLGMISN
ncbi:MAG: glycoside hydrolase family 3 N-terminal domain-containing protein [Balneolaceae bacterium]